MKILDWYVAKVIASTTAFCLLILVGLSSMLKFVEQLKSVGQGTYSMFDAAAFVFLMVPRDIEMFFPMAALLGALIGLGMMATNSELVVMQAAGISRLQVILSVMKTAIPLMILVMILGEWGAPWAEREARNLRTQEISGGSLIKSEQGLWAKDGSSFVHVSKVIETGLLNKVTVYQFDDNKSLSKVTKAQVARYQDKVWQLEDVNQTTFSEHRTQVLNTDNLLWQSSLTPDKLGVVTVKPESLSIQGLTDYLAYLKANKQDTGRYDLALWRKVMQPLTVGVMMLLALSFVFGPLRSVSMGARLVMGVITGFAFHLSNSAFGPISLVYQLPPIFGAIFPSLLFLAIAAYFLNKRA
ncbi:LPS export ABC transporter permease LptG [Psychrobium sp. 1_MG-2023]|uniref:LPS export ABC transporter permease LptG n=1 Tax=Psychrobium sp. 1_MG-2023 TaxID=3062624 RepID=UPI000C33A08C|nr:LPS export ABC transporter permease LptG [Psychrobium sp. 1_MG-2023]MDP2559620.1 LPS export ABC transporter permease LptG [Psychrobium sp. 1_MG-2023]PKF59565.1 lipopolysaccharide ABC transporter permease LptG [Alteromonadales bacterium alter-6D02]